MMLILWPLQEKLDGTRYGNGLTKVHRLDDKVFEGGPT